MPIAGIKVRLAAPKELGAFQEPGHVALTVKRSEQGVEVEVPRLEVHSMVVFE